MEVAYKNDDYDKIIAIREALPVFEYKKQIIDLLKTNHVFIIKGSNIILKVRCNYW